MSDDGEEYGVGRAEAVSEADAEAVRAYLVAVRGGAPLLSSTDARLLFDWLSGGVRLGVIARAIDVTAQRRIAKKVRAPLALASCKAEVERLHRGGRVRWAVPPGESSAASPDSADLAAETADAAAEPAVAQAYRDAIAQIAAMDPTDAHARCVQAVQLGCAFYEFAWASLDRDAALAEAGASLQADGFSPDDAGWASACEAIARDRLRRRYPRLTATAIWSEYGLGLA